MSDLYDCTIDIDVTSIEIIMCPIRVNFVNKSNDLLTSIGAKGLSEIGIVGVAPAIANAVHHATGKRIRELSITMDKLV